jgi:hypothetical protein
MEHVIFISVNSMPPRRRSELLANANAAFRKEQEALRRKHFAQLEKKLLERRAAFKELKENATNAKNRSRTLVGRVRAHQNAARKETRERYLVNKRAEANIRTLKKIIGEFNKASLKRAVNAYKLRNMFTQNPINQAAINRIKAYYNRQAQKAAVNARIAVAAQQAENAQRTAENAMRTLSRLQTSRRAKSAHPLFG